MGLLDRDRKRKPARRYQMREKLLSIGDDFWIDDDSGQHVYKVNNKAMRMRDTFVLEDTSGREVATIREKALSVRDKMKIGIGEREATVHKALVGIRDRYKIDVEDEEDLTAHGNIVDHEYEIERNGDTVARISKKWFRVRETYGVEIEADQDDVLLLAITVCVDAMSRPHV